MLCMQVRHITFRRLYPREAAIPLTAVPAISFDPSKEQARVRYLNSDNTSRCNAQRIQCHNWSLITSFVSSLRRNSGEHQENQLAICNHFQVSLY
jgi:hypothetical protein